MQYKKEDKRARIVQCAVEEFYKHGEKNASIRLIAEKANVAVGNIYNYFGSKRELYDSIIKPVAEEIQHFFSMIQNSALTLNTVDELARAVVPFMVTYKKEIRMLMNSESIQGEKVKEHYFDITAKRIKEEIDKYNALKSGVKIRIEVARAIGKSFLYGISDILFSSKSPEEATLDIKHFFKFFFYDVSKRV